MASTKKSTSQKRAERTQQENQTLNRVFFVFLLGLAAECYLFLIYRNYAWGTVDTALAWHQVLKVSTWLGLVMLAAGVVVGILKRKDKKLRTIMAWIGGVGAFLTVSGWVSTHFFTGGAGVTALCILVPIVAVLALIYLLYQHECALSSVMLSGAMFSVWLRSASRDSSGWATIVLAGCIVVVVALLAVILLTNKARQGGGKLWGVRVFSPDCDYRIVFGVLAVAAAGVLLGAILPAICVYLMWALGVVLFAELVYYTTKLM